MVAADTHKAQTESHLTSPQKSQTMLFLTRADATLRAAKASATPTFPARKKKARLDRDKLSTAHSVYTQQSLAVYGKSKQ